MKLLGTFLFALCILSSAITKADDNIDFSKRLEGSLDTTPVGKRHDSVKGAHSKYDVELIQQRQAEHFNRAMGMEAQAQGAQRQYNQQMKTMGH